MFTWAAPVGAERGQDIDVLDNDGGRQELQTLAHDFGQEPHEGPGHPSVARRAATGRPALESGSGGSGGGGGIGGGDSNSINGRITGACMAMQHKGFNCQRAAHHHHVHAVATVSRNNIAYKPPRRFSLAHHRTYMFKILHTNAERM